MKMRYLVYVKNNQPPFDRKIDAEFQARTDKLAKRRFASGGNPARANYYECLYRFDNRGEVININGFKFRGFRVADTD